MVSSHVLIYLYLLNLSLLLLIPNLSNYLNNFLSYLSLIHINNLLTFIHSLNMLIMYIYSSLFSFIYFILINPLLLLSIHFILMLLYVYLLNDKDIQPYMDSNIPQYFFSCLFLLSSIPINLLFKINFYSISPYHFLLPNMLHKNFLLTLIILFFHQIIILIYFNN